jgi:hypothetical protein
MVNMKAVTLRIQKGSFMMVAWGILLLAASVMTQFFELSADYVLWMWAGATLLGILAQMYCLVNGLQVNLIVWIVLIIIGWGFTLFVMKFDNGSHIDLYGDQAGVWLILMGLGYVATAFSVAKRFLILAAIHIVAGAVMELSARGIVPIDFLNAYSSLVFGLVAGVPLIIAGLPMWYRPPAQAKSGAPVPTPGPATERTG